MRAHWMKLVHDADARSARFIAVQNGDGSVDMDNRYPDPKPTLFSAANALASYLCADSRFAGDPALLDAAERGIRYARGRQNADGTFDYTPCNFRSAPDTAFIVNRIVTIRDLIVSLLEGAAGTPAAFDAARLAAIRAELDGIIRAAGAGMAAAGFHTPNHRWALAAALSSCARIAGDGRFRAAAERYLAEGIDCNEDGEYAERSAGNYNMVNNDQMIVLSVERQDASFLEHVRRNLSMMLAYVDPDGAVFTNNSTRQDRGKKAFLDQYYFNYLYAGATLGDAALSAVARRVMDGMIDSGRESPDALDAVMLRLGGIDYGGADEERAAAALPESYDAFFEESGIARFRRGAFGFSLLRDAGRFAYFASGGVSAFLKIGVAYFDKREAKPTVLIREGEGYRLEATLKGWYYLPFDAAPSTSDWWKMDHAARGRTEGPDLAFSVSVAPLASGDGATLRLSASGWPGVPVRFEFGLSADAWVDSEHFASPGPAGGAVLAKDGFVRARIGADALEIGPCFAEHRDIGGTYGSEGRSPDHFSVYCAAFTPFDRVLTIRRAPAGRS